jgi:hypothetical protein
MPAALLSPTSARTLGYVPTLSSFRLPLFPASVVTLPLRQRLGGAAVKRPEGLPGGPPRGCRTLLKRHPGLERIRCTYGPCLESGN